LKRFAVGRDRPHSTGVESINHVASAQASVSAAGIRITDGSIDAALRSRLSYPDWPGT
jgi:hypothetical protein